MSAITDSKFHMWRTLFAMTHADGKVSNEEVKYMAHALEDVPFSEAQKKILMDDIKAPQDIVTMFEKISNIEDQANFFRFAHDVVYADGDFGKAEQEILLKLKKIHIRNADVDQLIGKVNLEFESEGDTYSASSKKHNKKEIVSSFRHRFLSKLNQ